MIQNHMFSERRLQHLALKSSQLYGFNAREAEKLEARARTLRAH